jgi:hypothetical protein
MTAQQNSNNRNPHCRSCAARTARIVEPTTFQEQIRARPRRDRPALHGREGDENQKRSEDLDELVHDDPPKSRRRQAGYGASSRPGDRDRRPLHRA